MQNLRIENKYLFLEDENKIKKLWSENFFDDDKKTINYFLENVFENKKGVGAFFEDELIAMVLFLDSEIILEENVKKSVYFYAVCTDVKFRNKGVIKNLITFAKKMLEEQNTEIAFLVPANEELFSMYEKFCFSKAIGYNETIFTRSDVDCKNTICFSTDFCYSDYKRLKLSDSKETPVVLWNESEFDFIFDKSRDDVSFVFSETGFAIYEKQNEEILVYEICGNHKDVTAAIFLKESDCDKIKVRLPAKASSEFLGMVCNIKESIPFTSCIYLGMPYR